MIKMTDTGIGRGIRRSGGRVKLSMKCLVGAGHAAALLGDGLYVVGGGNNSAGCADMACLDLSGLAAGLPLKWRPVATAEPRSAIASEGLSLTAVRGAGALVTFGGYNGRYHNSVHVFRPGARSGPVALCHR